jgi:hypothetical protein
MCYLFRTLKVCLLYQRDLCYLYLILYFSGIISSMKQMEDRFNKKYNYPYVFLNEEAFSDEFKK